MIYIVLIFVILANMSAVFMIKYGSILEQEGLLLPLTIVWMIVVASSTYLLYKQLQKG